MLDPEVWRQTLRVLYLTTERATTIRNQAICHLRAQGVSVRTIASDAGCSPSTVTKVYRNTHRDEEIEQLLPLRPVLHLFDPASSMGPEQLVPALALKYRDLPPVTWTELDYVASCLPSLRDMPEIVAPPDSRWLIAEAEALILHLRRDRPSIRPEEPAVQYWRAILAGEWREQILGGDQFSPLRGIWLDILGRLTAESYHLTRTH